MPRNGMRIAAALAAITALAILLLAPEQESGSALSRPADPATANGASPESAVRDARETPAAAPERLPEITREAAHVEFHVVGPGSVELRDASLQWEPAEPGTRAADAATPIGTSDATGIVRTRFPLAPPAGRALLVARHVGHAARAIDVPLAAGRVEVELEPTAVVRIRAERSDGAPAPGVAIILSRSPGLILDYPPELLGQLADPRSAHSFSGRTDENGTLVIHGAAAGRYFVGAHTDCQLVLRADQESSELEVPRTGEVELLFRAEPLYAAVATFAGDEIRQMSLEEFVSDVPWQHLIFPQLERCRLALLARFPRALVIAVTAAEAHEIGFVKRLDVQLARAGEHTLDVPLRLACEIEAPLVLELAPESGKPVPLGRLRYRILDRAERELEGVTLRLVGGRESSFGATVTINREQEVPAGRYEHPYLPLQPWLQDRLPRTRFEVAEGGTKEVVERLPEAAMPLRLQLTRGDGAPIRGARIVLRCQSGYRAEIPAGGKPVLVWLPRGSIEGTIACPGCAPASFTVEAAEQGDPAPLTVLLQPR
ncbi:MAG: hypothetical protein JNM84_02040 [Planctomycetes bacterium]|nr:hypothetical protein [Planctomycetota bacterium]